MLAPAVGQHFSAFPEVTDHLHVCSSRETGSRAYGLTAHPGLHETRVLCVGLTSDLLSRGSGSIRRNKYSVNQTTTQNPWRETSQSKASPRSLGEKTKLIDGDGKKDGQTSSSVLQPTLSISAGFAPFVWQGIQYKAHSSYLVGLILFQSSNLFEQRFVLPRNFRLGVGSQHISREGGATYGAARRWSSLFPFHEQGLPSGAYHVVRTFDGRRTSRLKRLVVPATLEVFLSLNCQPVTYQYVP